MYIPAAHQALDQVIAERDGVSYMVVGRETYNDLKGHLTLKLMFVGKGGGIADSINVVFRTDRTGPSSSPTIWGAAASPNRWFRADGFADRIPDDE